MPKNSSKSKSKSKSKSNSNSSSNSRPKQVQETETETEHERPTFLVQNRVYVSAGVIPYTMDLQGNYHFLFQRLTNEDRKWTYEDFGGKSEYGDTSIENVAFRECYEETNYHDAFNIDFLHQQLKDNRSIIYRISECKYMLYLIYIPIELKESMELSEFGIKNSDEQPRIVEWLNYKSVMELHDLDLQPRLVPMEFKNNLALMLAQPVMDPEQKYY